MGWGMHFSILHALDIRRIVMLFLYTRVGWAALSLLGSSDGALTLTFLFSFSTATGLIKRNCQVATTVRAATTVSSAAQHHVLLTYVM